MGTNFASDYYGVVPDMLNFAKCVTNGVIPLGGVICRDKLYDAMMKTDAPEHVVEFFHGYTYSGHPVACAAAVATLDLYKQENLFARAGDMGKVLGDAFHSAFKGLPNVVGIRSLGLAAAVELAPIAGTPGKRAYDVFLDCFHKGALVRPAGDVLVIAPPYIVEKSHIDTLVNTLADSIKAHAGRRPRLFFQAVKAARRDARLSPSRFPSWRRDNYRNGASQVGPGHFYRFPGYRLLHPAPSIRSRTAALMNSSSASSREGQSCNAYFPRRHQRVLSWAHGVRAPVWPRSPTTSARTPRGSSSRAPTRSTRPPSRT
jgi:hypothetical protein